MDPKKFIKDKIGAKNFDDLKAFFSKQKFITIAADDGTSLEVAKLEKGAAISVVTAAGTKAADSGTYSYTDTDGKKWSIVVDNGVISDLTEAAAPAADPAAAAIVTPPAAAASPATGNDPTAMMAALKEMAQKFDAPTDGTPPMDANAMMQNLVTMMKAVMDYCFGYEIRQGERQQAVDAAIATYKEAMSAVPKKEDFEKENTILKNKITAIEKANGEQSATMEQMFELIEKIGDLPAMDDEPASDDDSTKGLSFKRNPARQTMLDNVKKFNEKRRAVPVKK